MFTPFYKAKAARTNCYIMVMLEKVFKKITFYRAKIYKNDAKIYF